MNEGREVFSTPLGDSVKLKTPMGTQEFCFLSLFGAALRGIRSGALGAIHVWLSFKFGVGDFLSKWGTGGSLWGTEGSLLATAARF